VKPLVPVLFGALVFHERTSGAPAVVLAEMVGLAAVLAGVSLLARVPKRAPQAVMIRSAP